MAVASLTARAFKASLTGNYARRDTVLAQCNSHVSHGILPGRQLTAVLRSPVGSRSFVALTSSRRVSRPIPSGHGLPSGLLLQERAKRPGPVRAQASESAGEAKVEIQSKAASSLKLTLIFATWFFFNVVFNIYNKKVLNNFPMPWLTSTLSLLCGSIFMVILWVTGLQKFSPVSKSFLLALAPVALFHTIGHVAATVSMSKVAVSFTHIIKASEPALSVVVQALMLKKTYPLPVYLSLFPIIGGCAIAATTELSFNWPGFWGAMISNLAFVFRNIFSKEKLEDFKEMGGINLYAWISIISLIYLTPVTFLVEGPQWKAGWQAVVNGPVGKDTILKWMFLQSLFYHLYNQVSYQALDNISPLTFSIGNTMKRVVVIVASVIAFRNPVGPVNAAGSAVAILGTFMYSQATQKKATKEEEKKV